MVYSLGAEYCGQHDGPGIAEVLYYCWAQQNRGIWAKQAAMVAAGNLTVLWRIATVDQWIITLLMTAFQIALEIN